MTLHPFPVVATQARAYGSHGAGGQQLLPPAADTSIFGGRGMQFGLHLVRAGAITAEQLVYALERQLEQRPAIGALAVETRRLTMRQVFDILGEQATSWKPFGEVAVDRGYLNYPQLLELLGLQCERCPSLPDVLADAGFIDAQTIREELQRFYTRREQAPLDVHARPTESVRFPSARGENSSTAKRSAAAQVRLEKRKAKKSARTVPGGKKAITGTTQAKRRRVKSAVR